MDKRKKSLFTGGMLVLLGLFLLLAPTLGSGVGILIGLGALFLAWGLGIREAGLFIPGGILLGLGVGVWLTQQPFFAANERLSGAAFMLAFGAGWALISLLAAVIRQRVLWPLIPAGIFGVIGLGVLVGGPALNLLTWLAKLWPLLFVALGLRLVWKSINTTSPTEEA